MVKDGVGLNLFTKITEEEKIAIENDGDLLEAPPGPFTIQPDVPGKEYTVILHHPPPACHICVRKNSLVLWGTWNGQVNNSPNPGQREWICLL